MSSTYHTTEVHYKAAGTQPRRVQDYIPYSFSASKMDIHYIKPNYDWHWKDCYPLCGGCKLDDKISLYDIINRKRFFIRFLLLHLISLILFKNQGTNRNNLRNDIVNHIDKTVAILYIAVVKNYKLLLESICFALINQFDVKHSGW